MHTHRWAIWISPTVPLNKMHLPSKKCLCKQTLWNAPIIWLTMSMHEVGRGVILWGDSAVNMWLSHQDLFYSGVGLCRSLAFCEVVEVTRELLKMRYFSMRYLWKWDISQWDISQWDISENEIFLNEISLKMRLMFCLVCIWQPWTLVAFLGVFYIPLKVYIYLDFWATDIL